MKLLDRYLSRELILPFLVGLTGFVLIEITTLLFNDLLEVMLQLKVPLSLIFQFIGYKLPMFVVLALPIATLFGVSLGINRLAREGEINAMRMSGVSLRRMLMPLLGIGLLISIGDYWLNEKVAPPANAKANETVQQMFKRSELPQIQADTFFHVGQHWFYVGKVKKVAENKYLLERVMIYETKWDDFPILTVAKHAVTDGIRWVFTDYRRIELAGNRENLTTSWPGEPGRLTLKVDLNRIIAPNSKPEEMSSAELMKQIQQFQKANIRVDQLVMNYHFKFSIPAGCLVVVLVSMPFAIHYARHGSFMGILLSILLFFFYYNTYFLAKMLGENGYLPPVLAAWSHNIIFSLIGLVMLWREE
ncbi:MAG: LptF/LptG family permease [Armatimonadetes bacterium]|nr:LptF/LptG family permease [Armatimonadota bacterium]